MTLNDIIMRDLEIARRDEERHMAAESLAAYEREINRRLWRQRARAVGEVVAGVVTLALVFGFCWLCCAVSGYHWE